MSHYVWQDSEFVPFIREGLREQTQNVYSGDASTGTQWSVWLRLLGQNRSRLVQCSVSKCGQKGDTQGIKTEESLSWYIPWILSQSPTIWRDFPRQEYCLVIY